MTPITLSPTPHSIRVVAAARSLLHSHALAHTRTYTYYIITFAAASRPGGQLVTACSVVRAGLGFFVCPSPSLVRKNCTGCPRLLAVACRDFCVRGHPPHPNPKTHIYPMFFFGCCHAIFFACMRACI